MTDSAVFHETDDDSFRDANGAITSFPGAGGGAVDSVFGRAGVVAAASGDYDANQVDFTPVGTISATDTQAAVAEVATDAASALSAHINDTTDAHDASAISFAPAGTISATDVQAAIEEVASEASAPVSSVFTRTGAVVAAAGDYTAAEVTNVPAGGIAAVTVQAALNELDTEKLASGAAAGGVLDGTFPNPGLASGVAGAGRSASGGVLSVNVDNSTLEIATDTLQVKALGITDAQVAIANKDGIAGTPSMRTLGTGATQATAGNDSRLSDSRAPSGSAGGTLGGTYPNPTVNTDGTTIETNANALRVKPGVFDADGAAAADYAAAVAASQPLDADLTAIAALDSSTSGAIASDGSGWIKKTYAQFKTALSLVKGDVGLGNVDNTADSAKNVATAAALTTARNIDGQAFDGTGNITVIAPGTHAATSKATPVDADELPLVDSAASNVLKKLTWANLKATLKTYFDTLYSATGAYAPGGTDVAVADGGTGASTAAAARTNLGIAGAVGGTEWTTVTKASDTSRDTTTSVTIDPELQFTAASAGIYEVDGGIVYGSPAGAGTPDLKYGFGEDTTGRGWIFESGWIAADTSAFLNVSAQTNSGANVGTAAANRGFYFHGTYVGAGGTFGLFWAQNTSSGNAT